jgi:hypothetical protein
MNKVLAIVGAALLLSTSVAQAVEVRAEPNIKVVVYGIQKDSACVVGANGNKICGGVVEFDKVVVSDAGKVVVEVTPIQLKGLKLICARVDGGSATVCKAPNTSVLKLT